MRRGREGGRRKGRETVRKNQRKGKNVDRKKQGKENLIDM